MRTHRQAALVRAFQGIGETGHVVTAIDSLEGLVAGRLQPVLYPDEITVGITCQQVQDAVVGAIRPGADGQTDHILDRQGVIIAAGQSFNWGIGVGERLEIGYKFPGFEPARNGNFALLQLLPYGQPFGKGPSAGPLSIAIDTSGRGQGSVPIRAGQARIHGEFVNAMTELFSEVGVEIEITFCHCFQT